jgi:YHS domain-containing protein
MSPNVAYDPVCGMPARAERDISASYQGQEFFFCSSLCRDAFRANPERFSKAAAAPATSGGLAGLRISRWRSRSTRGGGEARPR